ncbi:WD40 repeat-like protein [Neocallimastix lanati (nom. inval.)]|jgi:WD40 repeat protein|uniref:WD40 repeat-like protein n=1 Tax=Neocallimastix californiae TaxID=1754190 RepID=A0A1Y2B3X3_9FUNG|nr:WD40 repeat-like protein [Neocallimastix sp. JGI-2020a]ORY29177.1 WD40 repeat-like protein [Neocallimastix californiae]|eukprot:ORY29177.1 WD40 repeat-like protein [Neocallimastix californiae]
MVVKQKISYVVRENYNEVGHNSGINSLALDTQTPGGILYSAGKDSKINSWNLHLNDDNLNSYYIRQENIDNGVIENPQPYEGSLGGDVPQIDVDNIEYNESPDSVKDFSIVKNFHSEEVTRTNSFQNLSLENSATAIAIKNNIHKLKQKNSQHFDLRRKKCVTQTPTFNKGYWYHSDWVNDIVLTANKDHFVSASSDRSIYIWDVNNNIPSTRIGFHKDDVRVLAYSPKCNWVASGGFDQRVLFWDLGEGRAVPIFGSDDSLTQASIYSIATNTEGNVLVTGSPERIVRIWDTRTGKQVLKLTGHSDNVRALIISEDGKWVLSGSSDTTIKLWSIANVKRCVMTYSHYSDSVWSLTSNDPYLKTFWAGGRDGNITKINQSSNYDYNNQYDSDYGDCVLVCKENSGVVKLAAIDNGYIYAATSSSNINCWRDIPLSTHSLKAYKNQNSDDFEKITIQKSSIITQPNDIINDSLYTFNQIQSVASVDTRSISLNNNYYDNDFSSRQTFDDVVDPVPIFSTPEATITGKPPIIKFTMLNDRRHVLTQDAEKNVEEWDIILCKKSKIFGKVDYDKILKEINKRIFTENWCSLDIHTGALTVSMIPNKLFDSLIYYDECFEDMLVPDSLVDSRVNVGRWVLTNLMYNFVMTVSKDSENDNKLTVKTDIDMLNEKNTNNGNESAKLDPSSSSIRCLTPLVTEDSSSIPESLGDPSLISLGRNESLKITNISRGSSQKIAVNSVKSASSCMFPELKGECSDEEDDDESSSFNQLDNEANQTLESSKTRDSTLDQNIPSSTENSEAKEASGNLTAQSTSIKNNDNKDTSSEPTTSETNNTNNISENSEKPSTNQTNNTNNILENSEKPSSDQTNTSNYLVPPSVSTGVSKETSNNDGSSYINTLSDEKLSVQSSAQSTPVISKKGSLSASNSLQLTPLTSLASKDKLEVSLKKSNSSINNNATVAAPTSDIGHRKSISSETSGSQLKTKEKSERSFIRMIRSHVHIRSTSATRQKDGKKSANSSSSSIKLQNSSVNTTATANVNVAPLNSVAKVIPEPKTDGPINFAETPFIKLPDEVPVIISSLESDDAITYIDQDRETIRSLGDPNTTKYLCESSILPKWAYDCVVNKKIPNIEVKKVNFVLKPYPGSNMPSLPLGNNHLCANRMLRIRKVISYVVDKLNLTKIPKTNKASNVSLSELNSTSIDGVKAENWIEILCNDEVLDPSTTLATCRNHYQKSSGDVILLYRYIIKEIK